jgi:deoxyribose-phosphate aldolase
MIIIQYLLLILSKNMEKIDYSTIARYIDYTLLSPEANREQISQFCLEAQQCNFACVCVNPCWVQLCSELLQDSPVRVCSVAGFPLGAASTEAKAFEAEQLARIGAAEIDMVMNIGMFKSAEYAFVEKDITTVISAISPAIVKVIIETCLLSEKEKVEACRILVDAGAHFVKTSTGLNRAGATSEDVALLRSSVGTAVGVKAAGGIRDLGAARAMIAAGATRIGTSKNIIKITE